MHEEHFGNLINYNYAAVAIPYGKDMSFGLSMTRSSIDGIRTHNALYDANGDGVSDLIQAIGLTIQKFQGSNSDWAFYFTFAKRQSDNFTGAQMLKLSRKILQRYGATGIGFDLERCICQWKICISAQIFRCYYNTCCLECGA